MPKHHQRRRVRLPLALSLALTATIFAAVPPRAPQRPARLDAAREEVEKEGPDLIRARIEYYRRRHENDPARRLQLARGELAWRAGRDAKRAAGRLSAAPEWRPLGPSDGSGRMTSIAPHPTVPGTLYVGADGGGAWKTTDGGATWACLTDSLNNLAVGALALAPSSPDVVYLGTGSEASSGIGLVKSTDGGATWTLPAGVAANRFYRLAVHPADPQELLAATDRGLLLSTDGGVTWTTPVGDADVFDLVRDPSNPLVVYAAARHYPSGLRFIKSVDGGRNWAEKSWGVPPEAGVPAIAVAPSDPRVIYVSTEFGLDPQTGSPFTHVLKSTDGGETWADLASVHGNAAYGISHALGGQAWHDNAIVVSPTNAGHVMVAGVNYIRSTDGGATWDLPPFIPRTVGPSCPNCYSMHPDATEMRYQGSTLYIANDGGLFSTTDQGETSRRHNLGLVTRQYYALANDAVFTGRVLAGSQDNGTDRRDEGAAWTNVNGGDGFDAAINPDNPSVAYSTTQFGEIYRTTRLATSAEFLNDNVSPPYAPDEPRPFRTQLVLNFAAPSTLYTATSRVWRTTDGGDTWAPLPTTTTDGSAWDDDWIGALAVSRSPVPVLMVSKSNGVFRSADGGATWARVREYSSFINIEFDPRDPKTAYAVTGFGNSVLATRDGGATWSDLTRGLSPFVSPQVVRVDPSDSDVLYCGTMAGVFRSGDRGATWEPAGAGLPSVSVEDLRVTEDGSTVRAVTYGRGAWELEVRAPSTVEITGRMTDASGGPLANAEVLLTLGGVVIGVTRTDALGAYAFRGLARGRSYGVRAARQYLYVFTPAARSFNDVDGDQTADFVRAVAPNPVDGSQFFVRQHYADFLSREPDAEGLAFWTGEIEQCGADAQCREVKRINVSAAFFLSIEFQETGYLAYRTSKAAYGTPPGRPVPVTRREMLDDAKLIGDAVVVGVGDWEQRLERNKRAYFDAVVARQRFAEAYPQTLTPEQFVAALNANSGGALSAAEASALAADLTSGAKTRAQALRAVAEDAGLKAAELNRAFVLMQYFGYLRRDPDAAPDADFAGFQFWLAKLEEFGGDYIAAEMVRAFISATEYRERFTAEQLSLAGGEPGPPGDGVVITTTNFGQLDLNPTYPLAGTTRGLTLSLYVADEQPAPTHAQFDFVFANSSPGCAALPSSGIVGGAGRETIRYGARQGVAFFVPQAQLDSSVMVANLVSPGCGFTLADGRIKSFYVYADHPSLTPVRVDALAVGRGPTAFLGDRAE